MVSSANAQKKRVTSGKKNDNNVTKRGMINDPSAERRAGKLSVGPILLGFFFIVIVGSSLLQVLRTASSGSDR